MHLVCEFHDMIELFTNYSLLKTVLYLIVLGRNRDLQGLANAMVKLWEKNAIAKIAIKRGVLNTRNERMAEELKVNIIIA